VSLKISLNNDDNFIPVNSNISTLSYFFKSEGVNAETIVGLLAYTTAETICGLIALMRLGATVVLLKPEKEIKIVDNISLYYTFCNYPTHYNLEINFKFVGANLITQSADNIDSKIKYSNLAIATSGSTASPKYVKLSYDSIVASIEGTINFFNLRMSDNFVQSLPLYHIGGAMIALRSYYLNAKLIIPKEYDLKSLTKISGKNILSLTPGMLDYLINEDIVVNAKLIIVSGATTSVEQFKRFFELPVSYCYGMTETCSHISASEIRPSYNHCGKPLPHSTIIIDESSKINISGKTLFSSYLDDEVSRDNNLPFVTYDLGKIDQNGNLIILGRVDEIINSGGIKIDLNKIKNLVLAIPEVTDAVAIGILDVRWGERPVLFIETSNQNIIDLVKQHLIQYCSKYEYPDKIICLPKFPKSSLGKILRRELIKNINF
jgi:o-succinylbenzoate---CoA ligase